MSILSLSCGRHGLQPPRQTQAEATTCFNDEGQKKRDALHILSRLHASEYASPGSLCPESTLGALRVNEPQSNHFVRNRCMHRILKLKVFITFVYRDPDYLKDFCIATVLTMLCKFYEAIAWRTSAARRDQAACQVWDLPSSHARSTSWDSFKFRVSSLGLRAQDR